MLSAHDYLTETTFHSYFHLRLVLKCVVQIWATFTFAPLTFWKPPNNQYPPMPPNPHKNKITTVQLTL